MPGCGCPLGAKSSTVTWGGAPLFSTSLPHFAIPPPPTPPTTPSPTPPPLPPPPPPPPPQKTTPHHPPHQPPPPPPKTPPPKLTPKTPPPTLRRSIRSSDRARPLRGMATTTTTKPTPPLHQYRRPHLVDPLGRRRSSRRTQRPFRRRLWCLPPTATLASWPTASISDRAPSAHERQ